MPVMHSRSLRLLPKRPPVLPDDLWVADPGVDLERVGRGVAEAGHQREFPHAAVVTGREQCSNPVEWAGVLLVKLGYSSWLVIAGSG